MVCLVINSLSLSRWRRTNYTAECCDNLAQGRQDIRPWPTRTSWVQVGPTLKRAGEGEDMRAGSQHATAQDRGILDSDVSMG